MNLRALMQQIRGRVRNYNVFVHEQIGYDNDSNEPRDPAIIIKNQQYATRLYVILLISK
jgi:hypothetical protein